MMKSLPDFFLTKKKKVYKKIEKRPFILIYLFIKGPFLIQQKKKGPFKKKNLKGG